MFITNDPYKEEINSLVNKSEPSENVELKALSFKEVYGWVYISLKKNDTDFQIKYSSFMTDTSELVYFFSKIIDLKDDVSLLLDNEGSEPLIYAKAIDDNKVRFMFATDYDLYADDNIDYGIDDYKVELDIIIDKKILLQEFYNVLKPYLENFDAEGNEFIEMNTDKAKERLSIIEKFLS